VEPDRQPAHPQALSRGVDRGAGHAYAAISFGYQLGYGSTLIGQPNAGERGERVQPNAGVGRFTWDNFIWDGQTLSPTDVDMTGTAENVQVTISPAPTTSPRTR
jgi:hypothetical protein